METVSSLRAEARRYGLPPSAPASASASPLRLLRGHRRQPEVGGRLFTNFIIGAALAEALALIGFVLAFIL